MIDIEAIIIWAFISAVFGAIIKRVTGIDILGFVTVVVIVIVVLVFTYSSPTAIEMANFLVWGIVIIFALVLAESFSIIINAIFGKRVRQA